MEGEIGLLVEVHVSWPERLVIKKKECGVVWCGVHVCFCVSLWSLVLVLFHLVAGLFALLGTFPWIGFSDRFLSFIKVQSL